MSKKDGLKELTEAIKGLKDDFGKFITNDWKHLTAKVNTIEKKLTKRIFLIMVGFAIVIFLIELFA